MRIIKDKEIINAVKSLVLEANFKIGDTFLQMLKAAVKTEESPIGKNVLKQIIDNDELAKKNFVPMCQDTGMIVVFLEVGYDVHFTSDLYEAINEGVRQAYHEGYLRKSVVKHPLDRQNTNDNTPAIIHIEFVKGDKLKITLAPKGAGSENMSLVKMLLPSAGLDGIKKLVLHTIFEAGGKPCPPLTVGIGIGGNLEKAALIAKKALMREIDDTNLDPILAKLEQDLLEEINDLGIGPMGFGGTTTALAVKIAAYPCHLASLPVAINIQCHAARHKTIII